MKCDRLSLITINKPVELMQRRFFFHHKIKKKKFDSIDDSISSTNSSRSTCTVTRMTALNDNQSADDEPSLLRPTRTGRAKPTCYVCIANQLILYHIVIVTINV